MLLGLGGWFLVAALSFPRDTTPEGAYLRVVKAVNRARPEEIFAYTEEAAQHACYTIRDYRKRALLRVMAAYPEAERKSLEEKYGPIAQAADGKDVFAIYARKEGWMSQLRADVSGIEHVERGGERATVVTARGTRYSFRKRPNGIWGLTAFTPLLVSEAERAARDFALIERAASDYERVDSSSDRR